MKRKLSVLAVTALMLATMLTGSALPASAARPSSSDAPAAPTCNWDWDHYLWNTYGTELWFYGCDYGDGNWTIQAIWDPTNGYLYQG